MEDEAERCTSCVINDMEERRLFDYIARVGVWCLSYGIRVSQKGESGLCRCDVREW